jgi:periplasmic divalent cation tolerance protein
MTGGPGTAPDRPPASPPAADRGNNPGVAGFARLLTLGYLSPMSADTLLVLSTCPDAAVAQRMARSLVEDHAAACVSIVGPVTSVYRWREAVETAGETLLLIKTAADRYPDLERALRAMHPYEVPEIVAVPVERGLPDYLDWVRSCTHAS